MKKINILCALLLLAALLCGCGKSSDSVTVSRQLGDTELADTAEEPAEQDADDDADADEVEGQSVGQELEATYAADNIFSLNSVSSSSYNPYLTDSAWNRVVDMLVYETLVTIDDDFEAQPGLITGWQTEDGVTWTFTVDTTRRFHDGGTMSASDAVYSLQQAMAYGARYYTRFRNVTGVSEIDSGSFIVTLKHANYRFVQLLNIPVIEYGSGSSDLPPGTGPYMFSASGRYLTLDTNHPLAEEMPLRTIYLKEYQAAEDILQAFEDSYLDLVINDPTGVSSLGYSSTNIIKYYNKTNIHYLGYNTQNSLFSQPQIRNIITYGIDRASVVSDCMDGAATAATLPIHPGSPLYPQDVADTLQYSESGMYTALQNVGAEDLDGDGTLEFSGQRYTLDMIVCSDSAAKVSAARAIANDLRGFGLDINLRELSYSDYLTALDDGDFDIYYAEVQLCTDWDMSLILATDGDLNYGGAGDSTLDGYLEAFLASPEEEQAAAAETLCTYIGQNAPITVICFEKSEVLYHRGVLSGLDPTQDNIFNGLENWTINIGQ